MKTIKETRELVRALSAIAIRTVRNLGDGKISYLEMAGYLSDLGEVREGLQGISNVPGEMADLDDVEKETLLADIGALLVGAGLSHRVSDAAEKVLRWSYSSVRVFLEIKNAPPSAVPA
jgi:hypothetical protein